MWQKNRCLCGNTDALGVFRTSRVDAANYLEKQRCQSVQFNQREEDWGKKYPECNQQRLMGTGSMQTYGMTKINQVISRTTGRERDFFHEAAGTKVNFTGESHGETPGSYFTPNQKKTTIMMPCIVLLFLWQNSIFPILITILL